MITIKSPYKVGEKADTKEKALNDALERAKFICREFEPHQNYPLYITIDNDESEKQWIVRIFPFKSYDEAKA